VIQVERFRNEMAHTQGGEVLGVRSRRNHNGAFDVEFPEQTQPVSVRQTDVEQTSIEGAPSQQTPGIRQRVSDLHIDSPSQKVPLEAAGQDALVFDDQQ